MWVWVSACFDDAFSPRSPLAADVGVTLFGVGRFRVPCGWSSFPFPLFSTFSYSRLRSPRLKTGVEIGLGERHTHVLVGGTGVFPHILSFYTTYGSLGCVNVVVFPWEARNGSGLGIHERVA